MARPNWEWSSGLNCNTLLVIGTASIADATGAGRPPSATGPDRAKATPADLGTAATMSPT